jgi:hypothetical protein
LLTGEEVEMSASGLEALASLSSFSKLVFSLCHFASQDCTWDARREDRFAGWGRASKEESLVSKEARCPCRWGSVEWRDWVERCASTLSILFCRVD